MVFKVECSHTEGADLIDVTKAEHVVNVWGGSVDCQHDSRRIDA